MLEFRLLGPLEVVGDDGPLPLGGLRQRAILAALLLRAGQIVPTERLVHDVWGEDAPRTATTALQNGIAALRKLLGPNMLETRSPGYVLRVEAGQVDSARFEQLLADARTAQPEERAATLRQALALWRGPALADLAYDDFAQAEIRRLEELRLVAREERIGADAELGRHADIVAELESLVAEQPLRERPRELLMQAYYCSGRQAEALEAYQDCASRVRRRARRRARPSPAGAAGSDPAPGRDALSRLGGSQRPACAGGRRDREGAAGGPRRARARPRGLGGARGAARDGVRLPERPAARPGPGLPVRRDDARCRSPLGRAARSVRGGDRARAHPPAPRLAAAAATRARVPHQLIVTTNYDLGLERAFEEAEEELDVVAYVASGPNQGRFWHRPPGQAPRPVEVPNAYTELSLDERTVLLKLRGAVDPHPEREWESFVATEDDHIEFLGRSELATAVPVTLAARLRRSHFLFIGYEMADWNLRLVLNRVWGGRTVVYGSWAAQPSPSALERAFWRHYDVDVLDIEPDALVALLDARARAAAPA